MGNQQGNNNNNNNRMRQQQHQQQRSTGAPSSNRGSGEPIKFDSEFDFEQANAKFEQEIEKEFDKLKIGTKSGSSQQNQVCAHIMDFWFPRALFHAEYLTGVLE